MTSGFGRVKRQQNILGKGTEVGWSMAVVGSSWYKNKTDRQTEEVAEGHSMPVSISWRSVSFLKVSS